MKHLESTPFASERSHIQAMEHGSRKLLAALWASHPRIMQHLNAKRPGNVR